MVIVDSSSNAVEVDLPTASGNAGKTVDILAKTGTTNAVTVDPNGSETINGVSTSYILNVNYANLTLVSDGSNWVIR
jgi:Trm5-related predicted tRNA methylase